MWRSHCLHHSGATLDNVPVEKYEFSSTDEVGIGVRHSGVGSGVSFKLFPESDSTICLYTTASILCQIGWGTSNERVLSPPDYFFEKMNFRRYEPVDFLVAYCSRVTKSSIIFVQYQSEDGE
jgi:hypothetical protein